MLNRIKNTELVDFLNSGGEMMRTIQSDYLLNVILKLSRSRDVTSIVEIVRHAARTLTSADGATFILKDHDQCYYVDEEAISPLWKGRRFPIEVCISGWAMLNKSTTIIKDIYKDPRVPIDTYSPTFVKSLALVPINRDNPIGAIGNYWSREYEASESEVQSLEFLAAVTAIALQNIEVLDQLERSLVISVKEQKEDNDYFLVLSNELNASLNGRMAISNEMDKLSTLINKKLKNDGNGLDHMKKVIYEISLKQLNEMDFLLREFMHAKTL